LTTTAKAAGETSSSTVIYTNLVLTNVKDGVAESFTLDRTESKTKDGNFAYAKMAQSGRNISVIFPFSGLIPGESSDFVPISTSFTIDGATFYGPNAH